MTLFARRTAVRVALAVVATAAATTALAPRVASAQDAARSDDFTWRGRVPSGRWVYVKNLNGPIRVERGTGADLEVRAEKRAHSGGDPSIVRVVAQKASDGQSMVFCAFWNENGSCDESRYRGGDNDDWGSDRRRNVTVEFFVRVPDGVKVDVQTVNGELRVSDVAAEVVARTTNGSVRAETRGGPVRARTTNGSIDARMSTVGDARDLEFETTNGSIRVEMPASIGAQLDMSTVNGRVESEFPVTVSGRIDPRRLRATVGDGSRRVRLKTVNGSVTLRKAGD